MSYCTTDDLAAWLGITYRGDEEDVAQACIDAAENFIDAYCGRSFGTSEEETRTYVPNGDFVLYVDDLVSVTTLRSDPGGDGTFETTWTTDDFELGPANASGRGEPFTTLTATGSYTFGTSTWGRRSDIVQVTGVFGWPTVPPAVKQACILYAASLFKRRGSPQGSVGADEFGPIPLSGDRDVQALLERFQGPAAFGIA